MMKLSVHLEREGMILQILAHLEKADMIAAPPLLISHLPEEEQRRKSLNPREGVGWHQE